MPSVGVLISGRGSNLQALLDATRTGALRAQIRVVISNRPAAAGLKRAEAAGVETLVMPHGAHASREAYDEALAAALRSRSVEWVCLAGFMRLLGPRFCAAFPYRILNIHPSLLPAFPGVDAQQQALEHGVKVSGATVHFVTPELDAGPIILQGAAPVQDDDSAESLSRRILDVEHELYPRALEKVLHTPWTIDGRRVAFGTVPARPPTP